MADADIKSIEIEAHGVESSNIKAVGYSNLHNVLEVQFNSGSVYRYPNVSGEMYLDFINAGSLGKFFNSHIKGLENVRVK